MSNRKHIQDELKELKTDLPIDQNGSPFAVPEGYFEGFADSVLSKIKGEQLQFAMDEIAQLSPLLAGISRRMPFSVPEAYFQETIEFLPVLTSENEESLVLSFVDKEMPYQVPSGYFLDLSGQVLDKISEPGGKVIPMGRRKWMRIAMAAIFAGIITISGIFYFNSKKDISVDNPEWVSKKVKNVSDREIEEFVKTTDVNSTSPVTAQNIPVKTSDVKRLLQDVSDKDINAFLDQVPTEDEVSMLN